MLFPEHSTQGLSLNKLKKLYIKYPIFIDPLQYFLKKEKVDNNKPY